jgi:ATP-dependent DNA helicase PIF1
LYDPDLDSSVALLLFVSVPKTIKELVDSIYLQSVLQSGLTDFDILASRSLLTTLNSTVTDLNKEILGSFPGQVRRYNSVNRTDIDSDSALIEEFTVEYLESIELPELPFSILELKVGMPIILLRNLLPEKGLYNGTCIVVVGLQPYTIVAQLLTSDYCSKLRIIPRIELHSTTDDLLFKLVCKQFPVCLYFAVTINKSQGQSFDTVGVDLQAEAFSYSQFYIAMSRTSLVAGLYILLPIPDRKETLNVVYSEVLQDIRPY